MAETKFITVKGAKIPLDEKGNLKGKVGKKIEKTKKEAFTGAKQSYNKYLEQNKGNHEKASKQFFDENLKGKTVKAKIDNEKRNIHFTDKSWGKFRDHMKDNHIKACCIEDVPNVLKNYKGSSKGIEGKANNYRKFHDFESVVEKTIDGKKRKVRIYVGVGETKNNRQEAYTYKAYLEDTKKPPFNSNEPLYQAGGSSHPSGKNFIDDVFEIVNIKITLINEAENMNINLDSKSKRHIDENGFMHIALSNISKESINPYYGYEIPNCEALGLEPNSIYMGYRMGAELEKAAKTFNNLPLLRGHFIESAKHPQKEHRVGSVGSDCVYNSPICKQAYA